MVAPSLPNAARSEDQGTHVVPTITPATDITLSDLPPHAPHNTPPTPPLTQTPGALTHPPPPSGLPGQVLVSHPKQSTGVTAYRFFKRQVSSGRFGLLFGIAAFVYTFKAYELARFQTCLSFDAEQLNYSRTCRRVLQHGIDGISVHFNLELASEQTILISTRASLPGYQNQSMEYRNLLFQYIDDLVNAPSPDDDPARGPTQPQAHALSDGDTYTNTDDITLEDTQAEIEAAEFLAMKRLIKKHLGVKNIRRIMKHTSEAALKSVESSALNMTSLDDEGIPAKDKRPLQQVEPIEPQILPIYSSPLRLLTLELALLAGLLLIAADLVNFHVPSLLMPVFGPILPPRATPDWDVNHAYLRYILFIAAIAAISNDFRKAFSTFLTCSDLALMSYGIVTRYARRQPLRFKHCTWLLNYLYFWGFLATFLLTRWYWNSSWDNVLHCVCLLMYFVFVFGIKSFRALTHQRGIKHWRLHCPELGIPGGVLGERYNRNPQKHFSVSRKNEAINHRIE